ncbi:MAG TPA: hypothetical protein P5136_01530 [Methanofastidiosum sp.]|nr:hypothetical protein [Methanofastidiosum sp.]
MNSYTKDMISVALELRNSHGSDCSLWLSEPTDTRSKRCKECIFRLEDEVDGCKAANDQDMYTKAMKYLESITEEEWFEYHLLKL